MLEAEGVTAQSVQTHCAAHGYDMCIFHISLSQWKWKGEEAGSTS